MLPYSDYLDRIITLYEGLPTDSGHWLFGSGLGEMPGARERLLADPEAATFAHHSRGNPHLKTLLRDRFCGGDSSIAVTLAPGISAAVCVVCHALLEVGDSVAVEELAYPPMMDAAREVTRSEPLLVPRDADGKFDLNQLRELLRTNDIQLFLITNPHNPTSALLTQKDLQALADTFAEAGSRAVVVVDEAFLGLVPETRRPPSAVTIDPRFISVGGLNKSWGLKWLRCGWILSQGRTAELSDARILTQKFGSDYLEKLAERAFAMGLLTEIESWASQILEENSQTYAAELQPIIDDGLIEAVGTLAQPSFLGLFRIIGEESAEPLIDFLRNEKTGTKVVVSPGGWFGTSWNDTIRVNLATLSAYEDRAIQALAAGIRDYAAKRNA